MRTFYKIPVFVSFTAVIIATSTIAAGSENMGSYQSNAPIQQSSSQITTDPQGLAHMNESASAKIIDQAADRQPEKMKSVMLANTGKLDNRANRQHAQEAEKIAQEDDDC